MGAGTEWAGTGGWGAVTGVGTSGALTKKFFRLGGSANGRGRLRLLQHDYT